jgi:AraC-like DNA-binding protein
VREIEAGAVLIASEESKTALRASRIGPVVVNYFTVEPDTLGGLLSLGEQVCLRRAAASQNSSVRLLLPSDPLARNLKACFSEGPVDAALRLRMLKSFLETFDGEMKKEVATPPQESDGRERLRQLLRLTTAEELMELSISQLALKVGCSQRHLTRLFREEVGVSFRHQQSEMRLGKARRLLTTSKAKLLDVALSSGFNSAYRFGLSFKKRFGMAPGQWRQKHKAADGQAVAALSV